MAEVSAGSEKDPYMQAYITARMKNQVEEMKLQKILSNMEVSQRIKKIMINLELFEDRKVAHRLQQEVVNVAHRQRQAMNRYLRQKGSRHRLTSSWTTSMVRSEPANTLANSSVVAEDLSHSYPPPHTPGYLHRALASGRRAVFPVTKGKHSGNGEDECSPLAGQTGGGSVPGASSVAAAWSPVVTIVDNNNNNPAVPIIQVIDCSADINTNTSAAANGCDGAGRSDVQQQQQQQTSIAAWTKPGGTQHTEAETTTVPTTKTATIITPPHSSHRVHLPQQQQQQLPTSLPATAPQSRPESLHFPPVSRSTRTGRSTRTALTAGTNEDRKRLSSASSLWPGDPRAISSVRRDRRNIDEMLATMKSGEETRRLIREANPTCSRNCSKPNIMSQLGRAYINLPDLLPEIEKARQRMAEAEAAERELPAQDRQPLTASAEKRRSMGRFELEEEEITGSKNLPIYHIDYGSLRAVGGTRRNSVLA